MWDRLFGKGIDIKNPELKTLLQELQCISHPDFHKVRLPEDEVIEKIGKIGDPAAVPALEKALAYTRKYKNVLETLRQDPNYDPSAQGSGSLVIQIKLAEQTIHKLQDAIARSKSK